MKPIQELIQIRDVCDEIIQYPNIQPSILIDTSSKSYDYKQEIWNEDIHLLSTFCFLDKDEYELFAKERQLFLIKM